MLRFLPLAGCWLAAGLFFLAGAQREPLDEDKVRAYINSFYRYGEALRSRPVRQASETVSVTAGLMNVHVHTTEERPASSVVDARATVRAWLWVEWTDHRLDWSKQSLLKSVSKVRVKMNTSNIWTPSIQVLDAIHKSLNVIPNVIEAVLKKTGSVRIVVPVHFEVPFRFSDPSRKSPDTCLFTLGSMFTSKDLVDFKPSGSSKFTATYGRYAKEGTVLRKEVTRECCSEPFAVLEFRAVLRSGSVLN